MSPGAHSLWKTALDAAQEAAREAGALLRLAYGRVHRIRHKGPIDLVTEMDEQAQAAIAQILHRAFPQIPVVAEEGPASIPKSGCYWLVDPLDGTTNYAHGYPFFAVSIALVEQGYPMVGVVYNPLLDELFAAQRGGGATLNGQPIRVSTTEDLGHSLLASGFPYDAWSVPRNNSQEWSRFLRQVTSLRSDGAAALDLCHVAAGRIDGYWELALEPWDMAAGALIVEEAGGRVTQVDGAPFHLGQPSILASNGRIHPAMVAVLAEG